MKKIALAGALALACMVMSAPLALACPAGVACSGMLSSDLSGPATTFAVLPWYQLAEPYILTAFGLVFSALLTWALAQFQTRTGIHVSDQAKASINQAADNAAGRWIAAQEGNIAGLQVDVRSPLIATEVRKLQTSVPDAINKLGMTPDRVADIIVAKIGQRQANAPAPVPTVVVAPVAGVRA